MPLPSDSQPHPSSGPAYDHDEDGPLGHDLGLAHDLPTLLGRRAAIGLLSGAGLAAALVACSPSSTTTEDGSGSGGSGGQQPRGGGGGGDSSVTVGDGEIPEETNGPYPADGTNGTNVLTQSGIVRSDLRTSFGTASGVAEGVPLTVVLTLVDVSSATDAGKPVSDAAIYVWHCNRDGEYSMYSDAVMDENYLRGVQPTDAAGQVRFTTIFPAAYRGRWPHVHFEVYPSLADAQQASGKLRTSQLAFPEEVATAVYATSGYESSVANMQQTTLSSDMVFSDGYSLQMATLTGSVSRGYTATLRVPI